VRIVVTENVTLDGVIDAAGDWFRPSSPATDTSDQVAAIRSLMAAESAQLYGRSTFESFRSFWPAQRDVDETGISAHLDEVPKYVLSSTLGEDPGWGATVVRSLSELPDGEGVLGVTGSISVVHELLRSELVDELRLFVFPVVLGSGRRLVPDGLRVDLSLVSSEPFRSGVVLQTYRPAAPAAD